MKLKLACHDLLPKKSSAVNSTSLKHEHDIFATDVPELARLNVPYQVASIKILVDHRIISIDSATTKTVVCCGLVCSSKVFYI